MKSPRPSTRLLRIETLESRELLHAGHEATEPHTDLPEPIPVVGGPGVAALTPQALLPDMIPYSDPIRGFVYDWRVQGNELRLTTAMANIGTGPMEIRGGQIHADHTQDVHQRIYEPDGSFTDVLAGTFVHHAEHGHIHFEEFAEFRLRTVLADDGVGPIVATGEKVSFCLLDVDRYNTSGPPTPTYLTCGQVQGISVGWGDIYDRGLPGQSIDVTNVADGAYWLEVVVDPENHLMEADEGNNALRIQIDLDKSSGGGPISPDAFEANNTFVNPSILAPPEDHVYTDLNIHVFDDVDIYRVTASASGTMAFRLAFQHAQGDIDMEVLNASQTRIGLSDSTSNAEQVTFTAVAGQFYYARAYGFNGSTNPNYTFSIDQPGGGVIIAPDQFEENDTFATARSLTAVDQVYSNLSINVANDDDYYSIVPTVSGTMTVSLTFQHAQGDLDMRIYNASQAQLGLSDSTSNTEQISLAVTAGQAYYIRINGFQGAINPSYTMTVDVPAGGGAPGDALEQNDTFATARALNPVDQVYNNLSIDAPNDDDYYSIAPTASGTLSVSLAFLNAQGDIDMRVYNASQTQLALSDSTGNAEQISLAVTAGQTYFIRVNGFQAATNPNYTMTIDVPSAGGPAPDTLEENDTFATARSLLAIDQLHSNLTIDAPNDDDYYSIVPAASGTMNVSLAFQHAQGDIDMRVYNASQTQIGLSDSTGNAEQLNIAVTAGQTYFIRVYGFRAALSPGYAMTINVPDPPPPIVNNVFYVSTAESGSLASTSGAPTLDFADADILKLTAQQDGPYQYELHFDGSDVGLTTVGEDIDAFAFLPDGSIVISTAGNFSVPAPAGGNITGTGGDLLRFVPTTLGATTAGAWSMYFDGSDVGLETTNENIDAVAVLANGNLLVSTIGPATVTGASVNDEDLLLFTPTTLGATTAGTWSFYFDGGDVGLANDANEDINALYVRETAGNPTLYFSTLGDFAVTGVAGANEDAVAFTPTTLGANTAGAFAPGLTFDGSLYGLGSFNVDGIHLVPPANPPAGSAQSSSLNAGVQAPQSALAAAPPAAARRVAPLSSAATPQATSSPALLDTVLSEYAAIRKTTAGSACGCGERAGNASSSVDKNAISSRLAVWDQVADSLDDVLRGAMLR